MLVITRRRGIEQSASPYVPAPGLRGHAPSVNGTSPPVGLEWPLHTPAYALGPTALPGHAFFGADSRGGGGRHLATPATSVFLIEPGNNNTGGAVSGYGANVYRGTWEYFWRSSVFPRVGVPIFSGYVQIQNDINSVLGGSFVSYYGQFAPRPGLYLRATNPRVNDGSDWQVWHLRIYQGDDGPFSDYPVGIRDCFNHGNSSTSFTPVRNVFINCEFAFSLDELADFQYPFDGVTMLYSTFTDPLHAPPNLGHPEDPAGTDHGFATLFGSEAGQPNKLTIMRCLFAHATGRNPLTTAQNFTHANNLHYNHGRPTIGQGNGIHWHPDHTLPMQTNVLGNCFVRGPNNNGSLVAAACSVDLVPGCGVYFSKNAQFGWASPTSQSGFMTSAPGGLVQSTLRSTALPSFWGDAGLAGVLDIAANPLAPTTTELGHFVDLMEDSVGAQPAYRPGSGSRVTTVFNQIRSRLAGSTSSASQMIDTVTQGGGWPSISQATIDPLNPGTHWWAPLPTGSDRDHILTSGTLLNGMSAVGYTRLEAWALNQHYYVGGQ